MAASLFALLDDGVYKSRIKRHLRKDFIHEWALKSEEISVPKGSKYTADVELNCASEESLDMAIRIGKTGVGMNKRIELLSNTFSDACKFVRMGILEMCHPLHAFETAPA